MIAFVAGGLSALAMAPTDMFWVLFITFPILVWLLDGTAADPGRGAFSRLKPSFVTGWWFAFGYFLAGLWWIGAALLVEAEAFAWLVPIAVLGIPAFLALFWATAIAFAQLFWSDDWRRIVMLSAALGLAEYVRGTVLTGFPWNTIGYAALVNPIMMQSASVLGLYAITPLAILVFATPAIFAPRTGNRPRGMRLLIISALVLVISHIGYGYWRLNENPTEFAADVKLRITQPAILQEDKWLLENEARIFNSYISLSSENNADITHFIWPESAFPFILTQRRDALAAIANMLRDNAYLITGAMRVEAPLQGKMSPRVFNSVYVINHKGEIVGATDKTHLVPFGEYLPFQEIAESFGLQKITNGESGFAVGSSRRILSAGDAGAFLPLICYEIIFPGQVIPRSRNTGSKPATSYQAPRWIVNVTNDAWYGKTSGPYQHLRQSVIRGVEEGLPVIRSANSGISAVADPYGRIIGSLPLGERGYLDTKLPKPAQGTLYQLYRNMALFIICAIFFVISFRRRSH